MDQIINYFQQYLSAYWLMNIILSCSLSAAVAYWMGLLVQLESCFSGTLQGKVSKKILS